MNGGPGKPAARGEAARPTLARLHERLRDLRAARLRAAWTGALWTALTFHLLAATLFGALSAADPWRAAWPVAALALWLLYLWPLYRALRARRDSAHRFGAIAAELDRANPQAPDVFRTLLSLDEGHAPRTLDALEALYAGWEPRLVHPVGRARRGGPGLFAAFALLFALAFPVTIAQVARDRFPGGAAEIFARAWLPARALSGIPSPRLTPLSLPEDVAEGATLNLRVRADHVPPGRPVYVHFPKNGGETRHPMTRFPRPLRVTSPDTASFDLGPMREDLEVRFSTPGFATRVYRLRKRPPPRLKHLILTVTPPAYARLPVERHAETPALLTVLPGATLAWTAEAAEPLAALVAEVDRGDGAPKRLELGAGARFALRQVARAPFELRIRLADARGGRSIEGPFRVELAADAPPEIAWIEPSEDGELSRARRLPVRFEAKDDFGISRVTLRYVVSRDGGNSLQGALDVTTWLASRAGTGAGVWEASNLDLHDGDELEVWLEALDNDAVSGPKSGRSASRRLRLPSREEARASVRAGEREAAVSLSSALERELRARREAQRPDRGASGSANEPPPLMPEWELQRVLSEQPRQLLQETKRQLEAELRRADPAREAPALRALQREVEAQEKRLPPPAVTRAPADAQRKALERLNRDQKTLEEGLKRAPSPRVDSSAAPATKRAAQEERANRERLRESLRRNLEDQEALKNWMEERDRADEVDRDRQEQARKHAERMRQDMEKALEQIDKAMEKGLENGTLSPEMLEKMERVRELVEEVLGAEEKDALRRSGEGPVEAGDLQRAMQDLLSKKDGVRENLESAIRMLESLKEARALRELAAEMGALSDDQKDLASRLESTEGNAALAGEQQALGQRLDEARRELDRLAKSAAPSESQASKDKDKESEAARESAREARAAMQQAADALKKPAGGDRKAAKQGADLAAKKLQKAARQMEKALSKMDAPSDASELRAALEETLEFSRWLETLRALPAERRAWGGDVGARQAAVRVARWLAGRWKRLADGRPFDGEMLRREAAAMGFEADALAALPATDRGDAGLDALRRRAQGAARELLKWLSEDQQPGGPESGDGDGDSDAGGGESEESGSEGVSGRMKGAAARQNAVNRATQDLLQSFLRERQGRRGNSPGTSPGASQGNSPGKASGDASGARRQDSRPGDGEGDGFGSASGAGEGGERPGEGGEGGGEGPQGGQDVRSLANAQQQISEALEQWAESADDAGGAARKLRQLAAEARDLEAALRGRRLDPEEVRRRQERFRTRLLEAANALEERGRERERRAEAYRGEALPQTPSTGPGDEERQRLLKRRRDEALRLPLTPAQKRRVEWYYDQLLNP